MKQILVALAIVSLAALAGPAPALERRRLRAVMLERGGTAAAPVRAEDAG